MEGGSISPNANDNESATVTRQEPPAGVSSTDNLKEDERPDTGAGYTLQVASVQTAEKAVQLISQLISKGYAAYAVRADVNGTTMYRIRIGYFSGKKDAAPVVEQLKADQFNPIFIKL